MRFASKKDCITDILHSLLSDLIQHLAFMFCYDLVFVCERKRNSSPKLRHKCQKAEMNGWLLLNTQNSDQHLETARFGADRQLLLSLSIDKTALAIALDVNEVYRERVGTDSFYSVRRSFLISNTGDYHLSLSEF